MKVLYTRNYQRREERDIPKPPEAPLNNISVSAENIPEGYSGTAMLREKDTPIPPLISNEDILMKAESLPPLPPLRTRKFKVRAKISPSLLHPDSCEENGCASENATETQEHKSEAITCDTSSKEAPNTKEECEKTRQNSFEKLLPKNSKLITHGKKHRFHRTPNRDKEEKRFSLEDLLLGGIILLLLNEGADDGMILIFGYLLFSSF
jgi:hypothetical protein